MNTRCARTLSWLFFVFPWCSGVCVCGINEATLTPHSHPTPLPYSLTLLPHSLVTEQVLLSRCSSDRFRTSASVCVHIPRRDTDRSFNYTTTHSTCTTLPCPRGTAARAKFRHRQGKSQF